MKKSMKTLVAAGLVAMLMAAGCGSKAEESSTTSSGGTSESTKTESVEMTEVAENEEESGDMVDITIYAINDPQLSAAHYIAIDQGYYEAEGLNVTTEVVPSGPDLASYVAKGENVIAMGTTYNLFSWMENDVPIKAVTPLCNIGGTSCVVAKSGLDITKDNVKELEGCTIGMISGSEIYLGINKMCEEYGLDKDSFNYVNLSTSEQVAALASGEIDLMACWEPFISNAVADGGTILFSGTKDYLADPENGADVNWCQLYTCLMASEDVIAEQSDTLGKVMNALSKGTEFINSNREDAISILAPIYEMEDTLLETVMNENVYTMDVDQNFIDGTSLVADFAVEENVTTTNYTVDDYADWSILENVLPDKIKTE